jgi:hypothetical protein
MNQTLKSFCNSSNLDSKLIKAVVSQSGGWESFQQMAQDVVDNGASGGFHGFIYYTETTSFFKRHRRLILDLAIDQATYMGERSALDMVSNFRCIKDYEITKAEVEQVLYFGMTGIEMAEIIVNCIAWYALEEVCHEYVNFVERGEV